MKALKARWDKMKKRDKYISIAIFSLTWYTVASLIMTALGVPPPDVLTERWFKAWTSAFQFPSSRKLRAGCSFCL